MSAMDTPGLATQVIYVADEDQYYWDRHGPWLRIDERTAENHLQAQIDAVDEARWGELRAAYTEFRADLLNRLPSLMALLAISVVLLAAILIGSVVT